MFEHGPGAPSVPNSQLGFRTHDESPEAQAQAAEAAKTGISPNNPFANAAKIPPSAASTMQELAAKINSCESQRDFKSAIEILQQLLPGNMKSAELHHHLAIDYVGLGDLAEAVPEFRLASALAPAKKDYLDDYNRAVQMRKQQVNARDSAGPTASATTGAADGVPIFRTE